MDKKVYDLFVKIRIEGEIEFIERLERGYSNYSFKVFTKGGSIYKARLGNNNDLISRENELAILRNVGISYVYYEPKNGDSIWYWIEGRNLFRNEVDVRIFRKIVRLLKYIHSCSTDGVLVHDDFEYLDRSIDKFDASDLELYRDLVNKYKEEPRCLCHNDVSLSNLIYEPSTQDLSLIDYEWGRVNHPYWDYGNFVKESNLSEREIRELAVEADLELIKLYEFTVIATIYSIQLSYVFKEQTTGLDEYRARLFKQLVEYKKCLWRK